MAAIQILYDAATGKFERNIANAYEQMARAATSAVRDVGRATQRALKANITGAGFPSRWASSVKATYRPRVPSIDASAHIYSTINFLGVFENGARISGKPLLWLPLPDIPQKVGGQPMRPQLFVQRFGPLRSAKNSRVPLLLGQIATTQSGRVGKKTARKFRMAGVSENREWVPVFIGVTSVQLRRRLNYSEILRAAPGLVETRYREYLAQSAR